MGGRTLAAAVVALSAILAATGYGILLGTVVRTYEQASMFGAISIVIASAVGGIMVPVWAMPVGDAENQRLFSPCLGAERLSRNFRPGRRFPVRIRKHNPPPYLRRRLHCYRLAGASPAGGHGARLT